MGVEIKFLAFLSRQYRGERTASRSGRCIPYNSGKDEPRAGPNVMAKRKIIPAGNLNIVARHFTD
jgi:hypothetical protein